MNSSNVLSVRASFTFARPATCRLQELRLLSRGAQKQRKHPRRHNVIPWGRSAAPLLAACSTWRRLSCSTCFGRRTDSTVGLPKRSLRPSERGEGVPKFLVMEMMAAAAERERSGGEAREQTRTELFGRRPLLCTSSTRGVSELDIFCLPGAPPRGWTTKDGRPGRRSRRSAPGTRADKCRLSVGLSALRFRQKH